MTAPDITRKDVDQVAKMMFRLIEENDRLKKQIAAGSTSSKSNAKKLTKREVSLLRDMKRFGSTNTELATAFGINRATVSRIVRGIYH